MNVLVVGGGGTIGSTVAYTLAVARPEVDVTLADPRTDAATAHATDLRHSQRHAAHAVGAPEFDGSTPGAVSVVDPTDDLGPEPIDRADAIVVTASERRSPDSFERGGRLSVLESNLEIAAELGEWFSGSSPTPTVVVANPVDRVAHRLWEASGWPPRSVLAYSLSETARIVDELARREGVPPETVDCPVLGEHGEHMVPAFSRATVDGEPLDLTPAEREDVLEYVHEIPYEVIEGRGADDSSRWVTGRGAATICLRLLEGGTDEPICLGTPLAGEYGLEGVTLSVPVVLDSDGVSEILEWDLPVGEQRRLERAAESIRESLE